MIFIQTREVRPEGPLECVLHVSGESLSASAFTAEQDGHVWSFLEIRHHQFDANQNKSERSSKCVYSMASMFSKLTKYIILTV